MTESSSSSSSSLSRSSLLGKAAKKILPNVLLIVTDQFRYDAFGPDVTPRLHELATTTDGAIYFSNAYSSTPTCTPARAALLTGKSPWHHGMLGYADAVGCENYPTTLPEALDEAGYKTVVVGKNHFGTKPTAGGTSRRFIDHGYQTMELYDGLTMGNLRDDYETFFDRVLPGVDPLATCGLGWNDWRACPYAFDEYLHPTAWTTRRALRVIHDHFGTTAKSTTTAATATRKNHTHPTTTATTTNGGRNSEHRPLFLKVSYHRPHSPYDPPRRLWIQHAWNSRTNPDRYARNIGRNDPSCWDWDYYANYTSRSTTKDTSSWSGGPWEPELPPGAWHGDPGEDSARRSRLGYLASAQFVDEGIGQLIEEFRSNDAWKNTFVVWVSDHGDMNGDHNLWRKGYPWEASSHVNMVMKPPFSSAVEKSQRRPGPHAGTISDALVELRDVAPTLYDLVGILDRVTEKDPLVDGKSLLPILRGKRDSVRDHLDLEHSTVYDATIHWNAIVGKIPDDDNNNDGDDDDINDNSDTTAASTIDPRDEIHEDDEGGKDRCALYKYIFFAATGTEQLFCLSEDPRELSDLSSHPNHAEALGHWRTTMAKEFVAQGRGDRWVRPDGTLAVRPEGTTLGPNYPCHPHHGSESGNGGQPPDPYGEMVWDDPGTVAPRGMAS